MPRKIFLLLIMIFLAGLSIAIVELPFRWMLEDKLPSWTLAQYVGVIFGTGLVYVIGEIFWHPVGRILVDADKVTDPLWKRGLRALILVVFGMIPILVYIVWELSQAG